MRFSQYGPLTAISIALLVNVSVRADEERVEWKDLPAVVRESAEKAIPGAKWTEATRETDQDELSYQLSGADANGREVNVELSADGQIEVVETVLSVTDLPKIVVDVLKTLPQVNVSADGKTVRVGDDD
jgi:hypothetical protein